MRFPFDNPVREITYKEVNDRKLRLYVSEPDQEAANRPVILFFQGGSFQPNPKFSPAQFQHQAHALASLGVVSICVDYRTGRDAGFTPLQAIMDVKSAVRWVRQHAEELGVDPEKLAICGASAGGYISVSSIMFDRLNDDMDDVSVNAVPDKLVIFAAGMDGVDIMSRRYPELLPIAEEISPIHHVRRCLPQTLWICGTGDDLYDQNRGFVREMQDAGNPITFKTYDGMEHGFFNYGWHNNTYFHKTRQDIEGFLRPWLEHTAE